MRDAGEAKGRREGENDTKKWKGGRGRREKEWREERAGAERREVTGVR